MRQMISVIVSGVSTQALVWAREDVQWVGTQAKCPLCKQVSEVQALCDVIQYGMVEHDLIVTIIRCQKCGGIYAARYLVEFEKPKKRKKKNGI